MRFVLGSALVALFHSSGASAETCESYCDSVEECRNDPHAHGSYCKIDHNPQTCFGLYWTDEAQTSMCFEPNSADCPSAWPVSCPAVEDNCQAICDGNASCATDPHAHGSYCKSWQNPQVCFGLYFTDDSRTATCFQPVDGEACPETIPVTCSSSVVVSGATSHPASLRAAAGVTAEPEPEIIIETTEAPATTAAPATVASTAAPTSVAPTTAVRTTAAPTSVASTAAPTTAVATTAVRTTPVPTTAVRTTTVAVVQPSGRYAGQTRVMSLDATLNTATMRLAVTFGMGVGDEAQRFSAENLPYRYEDNRIHLLPTPEATNFLAGLPAPQTVDSVSITYNAETDVVTAAFSVFGMRISIPGNRV